MGSSTIKSEDYEKIYGKDWMKKAEKSTGDDLIERGVKLSWRSRLRRWWFGWKQ